MILGLIGIGIAAKTVHDKHEAKTTNNLSRDIVKGTKSKIKDFKRYCEDGLHSLGNSEIDVVNNELSEYIDLFSQIHSIDVSEFNSCYDLSKYCFDTKSVVSFRKIQHDLNTKSKYDNTARDIAVSVAVGGVAGIVGAFPVAGIILGFVSAKNAKALREEADVNYARACEVSEKGNLTAELFSGIRKKASMYERLLFKLTSLFTPLVFALENIIKTSGTDYTKYTYEQRKTVAASMSLAGAIRAVIDVPLLDDSGDLSFKVDDVIESVGRHISTYQKNSDKNAIQPKKITLEEAECNLLNCNFEIAYEQFEKLAFEGNPRAMYFLGKFYSGHYASNIIDNEKVQPLFERGMSLGNILCTFQYAKNLDDKKEMKKIFDDSFPVLSGLEKSTDPFAIYELALCYQNGRGTNIDVEKAKELFLKSAELNWAGGEEKIGEICEKNKKYSEATKWYKKAAERGYPIAESNLAYSYYFGRGVAKDYFKAAEWAKKAAVHGVALGQVMLGEMYKKGFGIEQNPTEAIKWLHKAEMQGNLTAIFMLGECYEEGFGVTKNRKTAVKYYVEAAEYGHEEAIKKLSMPSLKKIAEEVSKNDSEPKANETKQLSSFDAEIQVTLNISKPIFDGFRPEIRFENSTQAFICTIRMQDGMMIIRQGDSGPVTIDLEKAIDIKDGQEFTLYEAQKPIAYGITLINR